MQFSGTISSLMDNLSKTGRSRKQAVAVAVDSVIVLFSLWAAYSLRLGTLFSDFGSTWYIFVLLPIGTVTIFMALGIYRWVIRSSNRTLFNQLVKSCVLSALMLVFMTYMMPTERVSPRSLFIIFGMLLILGTSGARFVWQSIFQSENFGEPVAIYGAGIAGQELFHSLSRGANYQPILFLDDNLSMSASTVAGIPVIDANLQELSSKLLGLEVERVILAMPSIKNDALLQSKIAKLKRSGIKVQTIPSFSELISGQAKIGQVRDISITDILGRTEVPPNIALLGQCIKNRVVLVTGGGGSIGSELCRNIVKLSPEKLIVLDHSEINLYQISEEIQSLIADGSFQKSSFVPVLCSVTDEKSVDELFKRYGIDTVYHAAAYKHVPIVEEQPEQGFRVNVMGTLNVLDAAIKHSSGHFVLISTDKAVRPTNSMGASKRTAELVLQAKSKEKGNTSISMVRFGNVLGSSGSVVPKFRKQIDSGGPITLTHPDITRFFMTIPEAAQLVLQASSISKGGDVFVLDMGEPMRIEDLAKTMVKHAGKNLRSETGDDSDIEIVVEGLRPGEKMYEELFITSEHAETEVPKVFTAEENWLSWNILKLELDELSEKDKRNDRAGIRKQLLELAFYGLTESEELNGATREFSDIYAESASA